MFAQKPLQQSLGGSCVAADLDDFIEHISVLIDGAPEIALFTVDGDNEASGAAEFHPRALSEPDVILSHHPAPIVRPLP